MNSVINTIFACVLALILSIPSITAGSAQDNGPYIARIPWMNLTKSGRCILLVCHFHPDRRLSTLSKIESQVQAAPVNSDVIAISPFADRKGAARIAANVEDPLNMVFDNQNNRLLAFLPTTGQLLEVRENPGGNLDRTTVIRHNARRFGIQDPQGMALDEKGSGLFILDALRQRIVRSTGTGQKLYRWTGLRNRLKVDWFGKSARDRFRPDNGPSACTGPVGSKII